MSVSRISLLLVVVGTVLLTSCGDDDDVAPAGEPATVFGTVRIFGPPFGPLEGAEVYVVEHPELTAVTDEKGKFEIADVPAGDVTLVMLAEGYPENQIGTFTFDGNDRENVDFQAVPQWLYDAFAVLVETTPDPTRCQIATTVTRWFEDLVPEVHGEPGATAMISPELPPLHGPTYFDDRVLPTLGLTETSVDGGVVWTNVPPGDYTLTAKKADVAFEEVRILCRANVLVNAAPPWGLQALNPGSGY